MEQLLPPSQPLIGIVVSGSHHTAEEGQQWQTTRPLHWQLKAAFLVFRLGHLLNTLLVGLPVPQIGTLKGQL